jgi:hypothetical protein
VAQGLEELRRGGQIENFDLMFMDVSWKWVLGYDGVEGWGVELEIKLEVMITRLELKVPTAIWNNELNKEGDVSELNWIDWFMYIIKYRSSVNSFAHL